KSFHNVNMKLFIVCLAAACLCFVAVSANVDVASSSSSSIEDDNSPTDYEYIAHELAEDITDTDVDVYIPWAGIYFVIQKALSFIRGVKCTVGEVYEIKDASVTFLNDINQCGNDLNAKVLKLVTTCQNIVNTAGSIIGVNESVCGNTNGNESEPNNTESETVEMLAVRTPIKCFFKLFAKTIKLKNQIKSAILLIKQIPKVPGQTNQCVNTAVQNLGYVFNAFPGNVKYCSSLFKN
ncbi:hypothetical protein DOY81_008005, partial [Sarcophaga bullata]